MPTDDYTTAKWPTYGPILVKVAEGGERGWEDLNYL